MRKSADKNTKPGTKVLAMRGGQLDPGVVKDVTMRHDGGWGYTPRMLVTFNDGTEQRYSGAGIADYVLIDE